MQQMPEITPVHISVNDACARHDCSRPHLYILIGQGKVKAVKNGRKAPAAPAEPVSDVDAAL